MKSTLASTSLYGFPIRSFRVCVVESRSDWFEVVHSHG